MFCEKCGAKIEDGVKFCTSCGNKLFAEEIVPEPVVIEKTEAPVATEVKEEVVAAEITQEPEAEEVVQEEEIEAEVEVEEISAEIEAGEDNTKKGKNTKKIIIAVAAVIVALGILIVSVAGLLLKDTIFFAVSPAKYTGNLISETFEQMAKESEKINKNLLGFTLEDDEYTIGASVSVDEDYAQGTSVTADYKIANDPNNNEMLFDMKLTGKEDGEKLSGDIQGFWDNEKIGLSIDNAQFGEDNVFPKEYMDKYFVVSSKNFGDDFMNSAFARGDFAYDEDLNLSGLDLSYSNVMELLQGEELKPLKKEIKKKFILLLENSEISDRETTVLRMGDNMVNAKIFTVTLNSEAMLDFAIGTLDAVREDSYIREQFGLGTLSQIDLILNNLKSARSNVAYNQFSVDITEYDGRIVKISAFTDGEGITISGTDKKSILGGMKIETVSNGNNMMQFEYSSNWVKEDNEIFFNANASQYGSTALNLSARFDFKKEKFNASASIPGVETRSISGKCSKKDGFTLELDNIRIPKSGTVMTNSMEFDEWFEQEYMDTDDKAYSYYAENENYDDLWDIYYDEFWTDYNSYGEWYDAMGENYDENYMSYEKWLKEVLYEDEDTMDYYNNETGSYEYVDYNMNIKVSFTIKDKAELKIKDRQHIELFKLTQDELEEIFDGEDF